MRVHKKHGILLAGCSGVKIYYLNEQYRIVKGRKIVDVPCNVAEVAHYVNLKYQPLNLHESTINEFEAYITKVFL